MNKKQVSLPNFEYLAGKQVTEKLRTLFNLKNTKALAELLNVPASTIATWHQRKVCPYEVVIRTHLSKGVSIKWLLLDEGDPYPNMTPYQHESQQPKTRPLANIDLFLLKNGKVHPYNTLTLDQLFLDELNISNVIAVREGDKTYIIDQEATNATNGTYLIELDGLQSFCQMQRLPGKQLAIAFNETMLTVNEDDVQVNGKVMLTIAKGD
ncbi:helix-turn-helix domain-containing protein [Vibrio quintilis]|uniref:Bacteriophage CI repressor helix-turn-helix domain protein n=1 Tax=Vibrio quintilis TaxID=1117707 RepID=A0A1M7Z1D2_9VIBR|nr:helix-turn-helix domain-containing protein [Vibrio quintilis]SHO58600.1 Bacteriophage CI repressor helix-turn-helix domain protein [Vibrio quintilis]